MTYHVALYFEDGVTNFITAEANEHVADAAFRQGINIPLDCRDGACGTCKAFCESGQYAPGSYIEDALTEDEAAQGYCLPCQMQAESDLVLRILASSTACKVKPVEIEAKVSAVERLSPSAYALSLALPRLIGFLPGQYVQIVIPSDGGQRAYSFSSPPNATEARFLIRHLPGGKMTGWLADTAQAGHSIHFTGPYGSFYLRPVQRPVLMLAGGTGLAPFLSMLEYLALQSQEGSPPAHPIHLIYGVTADVDRVETGRIEALGAQIPGFTWTMCVADAASEWDKKGYVTHHIEDTHLHAGAVDVYLCGPPPMVEATRQFMIEKGVEPVNFYFEKFAPSESQ